MGFISRGDTLLRSEKREHKMRASFKFVRDTRNFNVYETEHENKIITIHLPKYLTGEKVDVAIMAKTIIELCITEREIHKCNCQYCRRNWVDCEDC